MRRGRPPLRDPEKHREWQEKSRRNQALDDDEKAVQQAVFARDNFRCALRDIDDEHRCYGPLTFQHRRKASAQGAYSVANGATLCAHGNQLIEQDARVARIAEEHGLVVREGHPEWESLGRRAARTS